MSYFVNTLSIRQWAATIGSRSTLPHVVRQLVWATIDRTALKRVDFPAYESTARPGFDGEIISEQSNAWVQTGRSVWELSVEGKQTAKADGDFKKRSESIPKSERDDAVFLCLTARHWQNKKTWASAQKQLGLWKDVVAFDADDIEQWMECAPGVAVWFAGQCGRRPEGVDDPRERLPLTPLDGRQIEALTETLKKYGLL